jgi:hypothetical protein
MLRTIMPLPSSFARHPEGVKRPKDLLHGGQILRLRENE